MRRSRIAAVVVVAACVVASAFSCVKSNASTCGDELCPAGLVCIVDAIDTHCVDPSLVAACKGRQDGMPCNAAGGSGTCAMGICAVGFCGDGIVNFNEDCDGSNFNGKTCLDFGATSPTGLACTAQCTFDKTGCSAYCGDTKIEGIEQCDGSNLGGKSCLDYGFYGGHLSCTATCTANVAGCSGRCGDGQIESPQEQCDGEMLGGATCKSLGHGNGAANDTPVPLTCGPTCTFAPQSCTCGGGYCSPTQACVTTNGLSSCTP